VPSDLLTDIRELARFWSVNVFWRALRDTLRVLRMHFGKELVLAATLLGLSLLLNQEQTFVDELTNSLLLLALAAAISGGALFLWQFAMAPLRLKREVEQDRDRIRDEALAAITHSTQNYRKYGSNIAMLPSMPAVSRQLGTELRDIRHRIELVKTTRPHPHYSHGFRLPGARFDEYDEMLAERPELYPAVEKAYTAAHHVNEALAMRETRANTGATIGVIDDDGLDAAYEAAGEALDALGEPRGEVWESGANRAVRLVTEDVLADLENER
jgi:hypothetical protein